MLPLRILNSKETKTIKEAVRSQFGYEFLEDFVFLQNNKNKVFITNRDIAKIELHQLKINSIGLYIGEYKNNKMRLSIEGAQLVAQGAEKNVLALSRDDARLWMGGNDISVRKKPENRGEFVILKYNKDVLGCGRVSEEKIANYVPKERRTKEQGL